MPRLPGNQHHAPSTTSFNGATTESSWPRASDNLSWAQQVDERSCRYFNGATTKSPWKAAENIWQPLGRPAAKYASMGPPTKESWKDLRVLARRNMAGPVIDRFNGATTKESWKAIMLHGVQLPRWLARRFNGATTKESWKAVIAGLVEDLGLKVCEGGFNGATTKESWKACPLENGCFAASSSPHRFNGATTKESWKHFQPRSRSAEGTQLEARDLASMGPRRRSRGRQTKSRRMTSRTDRQPRASMGPRRRSRGRHQSSRGIASRATRLTTTAFNGATTEEESWKSG